MGRIQAVALGLGRQRSLEATGCCESSFLGTGHRASPAGSGGRVARRSRRPRDRRRPRHLGRPDRWSTMGRPCHSRPRYRPGRGSMVEVGPESGCPGRAGWPGRSSPVRAWRTAWQSRRPSRGAHPRQRGAPGPWVVSSDLP